jgi:acid phosphatase
LAATAGNAEVSLRWNESTDPDGDSVSYNVYRNGAKVGSSTTTSFTDTGLTNGTTYNYQVSAVDSPGNESALSSVVSATPTSSPPPATPHIMEIIMENHGAGAIIGNSNAPFQNSLTSKYITLTNWTGIDHPSSPNYVGMVTGQDNGVAGAGDCSPSIGSTCDWSGDNLGNQMFAAEINAKWFTEDLNGNGCSIANSESGNNDVNHEPWAYMDNWQETAGACAQAGLTTASPGDPEVLDAINGASPPSFVWVTPNLTDDTHDGTIVQGDTYLKNLVTAVQGTSWYAAGGTIIITYDEDEGESNPMGYCTNPVVLPAVGATCIPTFIVSAKDANVGAVSTPGDHYGMLRSLEECYGLPLLNNAGAVNGSGQATYGDIKSRLC